MLSIPSMPTDYEGSQRRYPVLYLLHGFSDDETGWTQFGEVQKITNETIAKGDATQMIIAMPDGGVSWYINDASGKVPFEYFFIKEFIPYIDSVYKTRSKKEYRAVADLSMGDYGSLIYGMKHPDLFAACASLSAAHFSWLKRVMKLSEKKLQFNFFITIIKKTKLS